MKLDRTEKAWFKLAGVVCWSFFAYLYGGLYSPWVPDSSIEGKVWILAFLLLTTLLCVAFVYFPEEES